MQREEHIPIELNLPENNIHEDRVVEYTTRSMDTISIDELLNIENELYNNINFD